jgi:hypothetical protein
MNFCFNESRRVSLPPPPPLAVKILAIDTDPLPPPFSASSLVVPPTMKSFGKHGAEPSVTVD